MVSKWLSGPSNAVKAPSYPNSSVSLFRSPGRISRVGRKLLKLHAEGLSQMKLLPKDIAEFAVGLNQGVFLRLTKKIRERNRLSHDVSFCLAFSRVPWISRWCEP